jgi:Cu(I)/Ag(I) efflux system membrane fusion protein
MYAAVELVSGAAAKVVAVPVSAVIDSGLRQIVIVQTGEGRFEPRQVELGARGAEWTEILSGLKEGEPVVVAANFLIDAESNLRAALGGLSGSKPGVSHVADGTLDAIDTQTGMVTITHKPVASLKWPAMTMDFALANASLVAGMKPGTAVAFEFVERKPGEWVITSVKPGATTAKGPVAPAEAHKGH